MDIPDVSELRKTSSKKWGHMKCRTSPKLYPELPKGPEITAACDLDSLTQYCR